jgi:hypothetical protein
VNRVSRWQYQDLAEYWRDFDARRDQVERQVPLPLGWALIVIVLLSLELWGIVWLAVSALASGLAG